MLSSWVEIVLGWEYRRWTLVGYGFMPCCWTSSGGFAKRNRKRRALAVIESKGSILFRNLISWNSASCRGRSYCDLLLIQLHLLALVDIV